MTDTPPPAPPAASPPPGPSLAGAAGGAAQAGLRRPGRRPAGGGRRRRTRWRAAFFALAGLAVVAGVGWALLGDRLLVVRSVTVTGTRLLTPGQVISAADVPLGTPLLSVDAGAVTRRVEAAHPVVASVSVTEDWPDHLVIAVTERVPAVAVRMASGGYDLVDPSGVIVRYAQARPAGLPLLVTSLSGTALRGNPQVSAAAGVLAELQPALARQVAQVSAAAVPAGPEQVTLHLLDGKTVLWGSADNAAQKNRLLSVLLPGPVRYVDVSAPDAVVTR
jgi:cell division protein FtsQ